MLPIICFYYYKFTLLQNVFLLIYLTLLLLFNDTVNNSIDKWEVLLYEQIQSKWSFYKKI